MLKISVDWGLVIVALIGAAPGVLALLTRTKSVTARAAATAKRTTLDEFNSLFEEQRKQILDCRNECTQLSQDREKLHQEVNTLRREVSKLTVELHEETDRRKFLEQIIRMRGGEMPS